MLRRHSAKSKSDLRHRKSNTSVRSVHLEYIDAVVAQRDAQTAAMEAFSRAQGRQSAERALFPLQPVSANKENTSPAELSRVDSTMSLHSGYRRQGLERRQSVRFVGPTSGLETRASRINMRTAAPEPPQIPARRPIPRSQSTQSISYVPRSVLRNSENLQLPDRTSSVGKTIVAPEAVKARLSQACLQALSPEHEQYTPEDDIASMPSSYRRVRKTRSMLTTRTSMRGSVDGNAVVTLRSSPYNNTDIAAQNKQTTHGALCPRYSFMKTRDSNAVPSTPRLRAPKSMSFLKSRRDRREKQSSIDSPSGDASPGLGAQETSFRSRILPKPPKLFGPKCGESQREMPKTLRGSSANMELPASGTGASMGRSTSGSLRSRARKVSTSLRSRFKNLFINKSEEEARLPAQQIEAQRTHVSEAFDGNSWVSAVSDHDYCRERSSLSRVSTRIPSLHAVPSHERLHSRRGSIGSCKSAAGQASDEKSRVTSWASTDTNTAITHRPQEATEEWEKQRLSLINEHGVQNPLPSFDRPIIGLQTITSQEELDSTGLQCLPPGATVDSQRVYSALMKKMKETQQIAGIVEQQRKSSDGSNPFRTLSPSSSIGSGGSSDTAASTGMRHPQQQLSFLGQDVENHLGFTGPKSEKVHSSDDEITQSIADDHRSISPPIHLTPTGRGSVAAKTITDRGSAFFGSPTSHLFRTTSPYRRSLQEAMRAEKGQVSSQDPAETTVETTALAIKADAAARVAYSESNYSSDTLIRRLDMGQEYQLAKPFNASGSTGETDVFEDTPTYRPTGERQVSTASSIGWKTWLSADVAKLEPSPTRVSGQPPEVEYRIPTMPRSLGHGHVREAAQTGSCEEDEDNAKPPVRMPASSATPLSAIDSNVIKLSPQQRSVMRTTTPPAADLHLDQLNTPLECDTLASFDCEGGSYNFCNNATRPRASPSENASLSRQCKPGTHPQTPSREHAVRQSRSLAALKSMSGIREPQTGSPQPPASATVRLMRKSVSRLALNNTSATSTPGFTGVFERRFGSIGHKENQVPHQDGVQKQSPSTKVEFRGSKAMADLFLSSRRRQGASGTDASAFV